MNSTETATSNAHRKGKVYPAPAMRFLLELITWGLLLFAGYWYLMAVIILALSQFNFPGDKKPVELRKPGIMVPGFVRLFVEFVGAGLGIFVAIVMGGFWIYAVIPLIALWIVLDFTRMLWMLGLKDEPPQHVTAIYS